MKKSYILPLFLVILCIALISATATWTIGGPNSTVEVRGGMKIDSAFQLPWYNTGHPKYNKGTDTNGLAFTNTSDSLPYYMKGGVSKRIFTGFDLQRWDTTGLTVNATDTVRSYTISTLSTYVLNGYINVTTLSSGSASLTISFKDESNTVQAASIALAKLGASGGGITLAPSSTGYYYIIPLTIHCHSDSKIYIAINTGSGIVCNSGTELVHR